MNVKNPNYYCPPIESKGHICTHNQLKFQTDGQNVLEPIVIVFCTSGGMFDCTENVQTQNIFSDRNRPADEASEDRQDVSHDATATNHGHETMCKQSVEHLHLDNFMGQPPNYLQLSGCIKS